MVKLPSIGVEYLDKTGVDTIVVADHFDQKIRLIYQSILIHIATTWSMQL